MEAMTAGSGSGSGSDSLWGPFLRTVPGKDDVLLCDSRGRLSLFMIFFYSACFHAPDLLPTLLIYFLYSVLCRLGCWIPQTIASSFWIISARLRVFFHFFHLPIPA